jgi:hypothetical protein
MAAFDANAVGYLLKPIVKRDWPRRWSGLKSCCRVTSKLRQRRLLAERLLAEYRVSERSLRSGVV